MNVDVSSINPFIEATGQVFDTMFQCTPQRGKVGLAENNGSQPSVCAIIALSGTFKGSVTLRLPPQAAQLATQKLLMTDDVSDTDVADAIGEVVNMIAGAAKAKLEGHEVSLGLPMVVRGEHYHVDYPSNSLTLAVPFTSGMGEFALMLTIEDAK